MAMSDVKMKLKAAAFQAAAELGWREAVALLKKIASEIEDEQWNDRTGGDR